MLDDGNEKPSVPKEKAEWWLVALAFVSGMIVMLLFRYLPSVKWKRTGRSVKVSEALKILYPHINESKEIEEMVRKLYARQNGDKSIVIDKKELKEMVEKIRN